MTGTDRQAARAINMVLWRDWDPIGGVPESEYEDYVWPIYRLLAAGAERNLVGAFLLYVATDKLGLTKIDEARLDLALDNLMAIAIAAPENEP